MIYEIVTAIIIVNITDINIMIVIVRENLITNTNDNMVSTIAATNDTMATWVQCSWRI